MTRTVAPRRRRKRVGPTVAIAGLGLIGGSLAKALTRAGWRVIGVDEARIRRRARRAGVVARTSASLREAMGTATIVVLAAPPRTNLRLLRQVARDRPPGIIVTDVGSVKEGICAEARRLGLKDFVGGHPMAGATASGFDASAADLFAGRTWILLRGSSRRAFAAVRRLVRAVGGEPVVLTGPDRHDRIMAFLSHLPQILSWALRAAAMEDPAILRQLALAGPGYRDMTRLAASPRILWSQILGENRSHVFAALSALQGALRREEKRLRSY